MNIADLILLIAWCFFATRGYSRGLIKEAASLLGIVAAIHFANVYSAALAPHLSSLMSSPEYTKLAAFILIMLAVILLVRVLVLGLTGLIKLAMVQWADHFIGLLFGLAKGVIISALVLMVVNAYVPKPEFTRDSKLVPYLDKVKIALMDYIPQDMREKIMQTAYGIQFKK